MNVDRWRHSRTKCAVAAVGPQDAQDGRRQQNKNEAHNGEDSWREHVELQSFVRTVAAFSEARWLSPPSPAVEPIERNIPGGFMVSKRSLEPIEAGNSLQRCPYDTRNPTRRPPRQKTDQGSHSQTDKPWEGNPEKEQRSGMKKSDLGKWQETNTH